MGAVGHLAVFAFEYARAFTLRTLGVGIGIFLGVDMLDNLGLQVGVLSGGFVQRVRQISKPHALCMGLDKQIMRLYKGYSIVSATWCQTN